MLTSRRFSTLLFFVIIILVTSSLVTFMTNGQEEASTTSGTPTDSQALKKAPFSVVTVDSHATKQPLTASIIGETEAAFRVTIRAETTGQIVKRPVNKGDTVRKNDILCQVDPGTQAADIARAEAALVKAEFDLSASMKLFETGNVAKNRIQAERARVNAARADLAASRLNQKRLLIKAPRDGVVEGSLPEVGDQLGIGTACATLVSYNPIIITGRFSERYLGRIVPGAEVEATISNGIRVKGIIDYITASADPQTRTFKLESRIDNADGQIGEGMSARLIVSLGEEAVHIIPRMALSLNENGLTGVKILRDSKVYFVPVTIVNETTKGLWVLAKPKHMAIITMGHEYVLEGQQVEAVHHSVLERKL